MRTTHLENELHVPTSIVVTAILTGAVSIFVWVIRLAARSTLEQFRMSLQAHTDAIRDLASEVKEHRRELEDVRAEMADIRARMLLQTK